MRLCLHCDGRKAVTARGLCTPCGAERKVARKYPILPASAREMCRHCGDRLAVRARGLCTRCHGDAAVRESYPAADGSYADAAEQDFNGTPPLPAEPTSAPPGSESKIRVLRARAKQKVQLHHPRDVRNWDGAAMAAVGRLLRDAVAEPGGDSGEEDGEAA